MPLIKNLLFFLFGIILIVSCNNNESLNDGSVWVGGEIVNPKTDYVVLYKNNCILDTIKLDKENFFLHQIKDGKKGLYSFRHGEYQIFYLEPGDSLMLRVNTVDFDESLTYTGKGAEKNNFLMEMFLMNEAERQDISTWYTLPPKEFQIKIDSLKKIRTNLYSEFSSKVDPSDDFRKIANANIEYSYNINKESYASVNFLKYQNDKSIYPPNFFDHRKQVNFGNDELKSYYPYYRFIDGYLDNLSFKKYYKNDVLDRNSYIHNYNKVKIIDSLVTNDSLKNKMLKTVVSRYLINGKDAENEQQMVSLFLELNTNKDHHREMNELAEATINITRGKVVPNVLLVNADNTAKDLHTIIKNKTVLFFWSSRSIKHYKTIHSKVAELKSKYPEYDFIGINTDTHFKKWRDVVRKSGYNLTHEYQLENIEEAEKKLVISSVNKAIILDKDGVILDGNANLFGNSMEKLLLGFLNQ